MAVKKVGGSSKNNRDSHSKRLGVKVSHNQFTKAGSIIIRQNGANKKSGINTYYGVTYNIHASIDGFVKFIQKSNHTYVTVVLNSSL